MTCPACQGRGKRPTGGDRRLVYDPSVQRQRAPGLQDCRTCQGSGQVEECGKCQGRGYTSQPLGPCLACDTKGYR